MVLLASAFSSTVHAQSRARVWNIWLRFMVIAGGLHCGVNRIWRYLFHLERGFGSTEDWSIGEYKDNMALSTEWVSETKRHETLGENDGTQWDRAILELRWVLLFEVRLEGFSKAKDTIRCSQHRSRLSSRLSMAKRNSKAFWLQIGDTHP